MENQETVTIIIEVKGNNMPKDVERRLMDSMFSQFEDISFSHKIEIMTVLPLKKLFFGLYYKG